MKQLLSQKETVLSLFNAMVSQFDSSTYPELEAAYQFVFTDIDGGYPVTIMFSRGAASFREGFADNPSVTVRTPSELWLDIAGGFRNPLWALVTKKFTLQGKLSHLSLLPKLLTRKFETPRSKKFFGEWSVPSRVLVLIGNPRKRNGLTPFYLQPFIEGMKSAGAIVEEVYLYDKSIKPCLGCFQCWTRTPGRCVQKDDQRELLDKLEGAELIVYALPLYYHSIPGLMKNHFDRQLPMLHPFMEDGGGFTRHPRRNSVNQSLVLFSICGFPELAEFDALVATFEAYAKHANAFLRANVLIPSAMESYYNPTARSVLMKKLASLGVAGNELILKGSINRRTLRAIANVPLSPKQWRHGANIHWWQETQEAISSEPTES